MSRTLSTRKQRGMTLVAALFLIVVLGALGLFAMRIGVAQQDTVNLGMLSDRAVVAANMGVEWAAIRTAALTACAATGLNPNGALSGFTVTVTCTAYDHGADGFVYEIRSTATFGTYGAPTFVSRTMTARLPT